MSEQHQSEQPRSGSHWRRDLLFLSVCGLAVAALAASLLPETPDEQPLADASHQRPRWQRQQTESVVALVDAALAEDIDPQSVAPPADRLTIARRLWLALMGTIPSLEEIRQLESAAANNYPPPPSSGEGVFGAPVDPAGIDRMLDHIFADPRHADYLTERFARALVGVEDGPFLLYRRRRFTTWLSDQILANRHYDDIIREMITARGLWTDQPAGNFITVALVQQNEDDPLDEALLTSRLSRALLGVRLDCAECHDHPFAKWTQRDFQGLAAFFAGTTPSLRGIRDDDSVYKVEDRQTGQSVEIEPAVPFAAASLPADGGNRARLVRWLTAKENTAFARATVNRVWAMMLGRPLVEPVDDIPIDEPSPALDRLAESFAASDYDLRELVRAIAHTEAFCRQSRTTAEQPAGDWAVFPLTRLRPEQVVGALAQSAKVQTIDRESHILVKLARSIQQSEFIERYGDAGADELEPRGGTIQQRLVMMNGKLVTEKSSEGPFRTVARVAMLAPDDESAIETTYLAVLTRRPTAPELKHFTVRLADTELSREHVLEDIYWSLVNSTEFSWNH